MAEQQQHQYQHQHQHHHSDEETLDQASDENNEIEKLEEEVKLMAQKISEFRDTLPNQLQTNLASILSSQRPVVHFNPSLNDPEPSSTTHNPGSESGAVIEDDQAHSEKIQTIKQKISSNASAMSSLLKRMNNCMSRIDKLESFNNGIHPAFKRRKITSENSLV